MADKEDATDVRWDHAVNSKQKLEKALRGLFLMVCYLQIILLAIFFWRFCFVI